MRLPYFLLLTSLQVFGAGCSVEPKDDEKSGPKQLDANPVLKDKSFRDDEFLCDPGETELTLQNGNAPVTYESHIKQLMETYCVLCHPTLAPPDLKGYEAAKAAGEASVMTVVNGTMPPNAPLAAEDIALFEAWQAGGFLLEVEGGSGPVDDGDDDSGNDGDDQDDGSTLPPSDGGAKCWGGSGSVAADDGDADAEDASEAEDEDTDEGEQDTTDGGEVEDAETALVPFDADYSEVEP